MAVGWPSFWVNATPITVAASPLLSPFLFVARFANVVPIFPAFTGGTSVHTVEWSLDGVTAELTADFAIVTPVSGTPIAVIAPYVRWRTVQTVADSTKSKVALMGR
jgi:hypothetical protein